jgi:hypothetical protein
VRLCNQLTRSVANALAPLTHTLCCAVIWFLDYAFSLSYHVIAIDVQVEHPRPPSVRRLLEIGYLGALWKHSCECKCIYVSMLIVDTVLASANALWGMIRLLSNCMWCGTRSLTGSVFEEELCRLSKQHR